MRSVWVTLCSLAAVPALKAQSLWIHGTYSPRTANTPSSTPAAPAQPSAPAPAPAPAATPAAAPVPATAADQTSPSTTEPSLPPPTLQAPKRPQNEISASGDFMFGQGTVSYPFGYSLAKTLNESPNGLVSSFTVPRDSVYYGGTVSYSYGQGWFIDFSYRKGNSSGTADLPMQSLGTMHSSFSIDDSWYQVYLSYRFPQLRGGRTFAYVRAGATYVTADLSDNATSPEVGRYTQTDSTTEIQGNLGLGLGYAFYPTLRLRIAPQLEIEGFYGQRSQSSLEFLSGDSGPGVVFQSANIDNDLYGGIGRATVRLDYKLGQSGLFKVFGEAGIEGRYILVDYPNSGTQDESLWGPYVKLGLRYQF